MQPMIADYPREYKRQKQMGRIGTHADTTWRPSPVFRLSGLHVDHAAGHWGQTSEYVIIKTLRKISFRGHI